MKPKRPATKAGTTPTTPDFQAATQTEVQPPGRLRQYRLYCTHPLFSLFPTHISLLPIHTSYPYPHSHPHPSLSIKFMSPFPPSHPFSSFIHGPSFGSPIHNHLCLPCRLLSDDSHLRLFPHALPLHSPNAGPCPPLQPDLADSFIPACLSTSAIGGSVEGRVVDAPPFPSSTPLLTSPLAAEASGGCIARCGSMAGSPAGPPRDSRTPAFGGEGRSL